MSKESIFFSTSVGCMDARTQGPIKRLAKKLTGGKPDAVTDAGMVGKIINPEFNLEPLKSKLVDVSISHHSSRGVIVSGHHDCAGHKVDKEQHIKDIKEATDKVRTMISDAGKEVPVYGVYVEPRKRIFLKPKWKAKVVDWPTEPEIGGIRNKRIFSNVFKSTLSIRK